MFESMLGFPMYIDTHAHLDDEQFDEIRNEVVTNALAEGVEHIICIGTTAAASRRCAELAGQYPCISAAVGIQPNYVSEVREGDWAKIVELTKQPNVVAIGETGLDYYWDYAKLDEQEIYFRRHIELSIDTALPFVVHMREPKSNEKDSWPCSAHIARIIRELAGEATLAGVMHSYTGNSEFAQEFLNMGMHISFAGMVTYKKSHDLREVARTIPLNRVLVETDAPYLSPEPVRGCRPNQPANVVHTVRCLAEVYDIEPDELAKITSDNARRLFGFSS